MRGRCGTILSCCTLGTVVLGALPSSALASGPEAHATEVGAVPASQQIQLVLPLKGDSAGLARFAGAVTTPGSAQYGAYESIAALARRFGASQATRKRVLGYLRNAGASAVKLDATGLFADATISAGLAERLFEAPLARFRAASGARFVAPAPAAAVSVPTPLRGLVGGVVGLDTRPLLRPPGLSASLSRARARARAAQGQPTSGYAPRSGGPSGCAAGVGSGGFTPNQYLTAYDYDPLRSAGMLGRGERVALIEIDGFKYSDITTFAGCFGLPVAAIRGFGVGLSRLLPPGGETTLDVEVLDASAPGLKAIDVYESGASAAETLRAFTAPLQTQSSKPQVISVSLGLCEPALVESVGTAGINATQGALEMAAASGITFLGASGDSGSADCTDSNGVPLDRLAVNYPASSRWVTGVGGTNFVLNGANQITGQTVWNDTGAVPGSAAGGGFSTVFGRPPYQTGAVSANARAVPDVSMLADVAPGYAIYCSAAPACVNSQNTNPWITVGGTSAATPLLAGGFALVDQELRLRGRQDLGLVNPLLYAIGGSTRSSQVFSDVTQYGNDVGPYIPGDGQPLGCCGAVPGFDEASGFGSVDLANFAAMAVSAQPRIVNLGLSLQRDRRPVRYHRILATVSCSDSCVVGAVATIRIGRSRPFPVVSHTYRLRTKGKKTIALRFTSSELGRLRAGLKHHERIFARVLGVIVNQHGDPKQQTAVKQLTIRG